MKFLAAGLIPVALFYVVLMPPIYYLQRLRISHEIREITNVHARLVSSILSNNADVVSFISKLRLTKLVLINKETTETQPIFDSVNTFLRNYAEAQGLFSCSIIDPNGTIVCSSDPECIGNKTNLSTTFLPNTIHEGALVRGYIPQTLEDQFQYKDYVATVRGNHGKPLGFVAQTNSLNVGKLLCHHMNNQWKDLRLIQIDRENNVITDIISSQPLTLNDDRLRDFRNSWTASMIRKGNDKQPFSAKINGTTHVCYGTFIEPANGYIFHAYPLHSGRMILLNSLVLLALLFPLTFGGAIVLAFIMSRKLYRQWGQINDILKEMKTRGDLLTPLPFKSDCEEIHAGIRSFNTLLDDLRQKQQQLINRFKYDSMTGLYTRAAFREIVEELIAKYDPDVDAKQSHLAFVYMDIDNFKNFNTLYGHVFGDRVIKYIGQTLLNEIEGRGYSGRQGGDEFVLCLTDHAIIENLDEFTTDLRNKLADDLRLREGDTIRLSCSIGVSRFPENGNDYETLINKADEAMYEVKKQRKDGAQESE